MYLPQAKCFWRLKQESRQISLSSLSFIGVFQLLSHIKWRQGSEVMSGLHSHWTETDKQGFIWLKLLSPRCTRTPPCCCAHSSPGPEARRRGPHPIWSTTWLKNGRVTGHWTCGSLGRGRAKCRAHRLPYSSHGPIAAPVCR